CRPCWPRSARSYARRSTAPTSSPTPTRRISSPRSHAASTSGSGSWKPIFRRSAEAVDVCQVSGSRLPLTASREVEEQHLGPGAGTQLDNALVGERRPVAVGERASVDVDTPTRDLHPGVPTRTQLVSHLQ